MTLQTAIDIMFALASGNTNQNVREALKTLDDFNHKQKKYRWHDLRKNPDDLPDTDRDVEIIVNAQFSDKPFHLIARSADKEGHIWEISGQVFYETLDTSTIRVIAWREIQPYEGGE